MQFGTEDIQPELLTSENKFHVSLLHVFPLHTLKSITISRVRPFLSLHLLIMIFSMFLRTFQHTVSIFCRKTKKIHVKVRNLDILVKLLVVGWCRVATREHSWFIVNSRRVQRAGLEPLYEMVIFGDVHEAVAPSESPYKELLAGMESGLSASLSLLREAGSFASTRHLQPVSLTSVTPAP